MIIYEYHLREMCHDVRNQETCAQPIGEAPLAHPIFGCYTDKWHVDDLNIYNHEKIENETLGFV